VNCQGWVLSSSVVQKMCRSFGHFVFVLNCFMKILQSRGLCHFEISTRYQMVLPFISSYYECACARCWVHSSCPSLRGGYCWAVVGQTGSQSTQIIDNIKRRVDNAMEVPDVFANPLVSAIMKGILSEYHMLQEEPVSWRRTRSHNP